MCKLWKKEVDVFHAVMTKAKRSHQLVSIFVKNGYRISGYVIGIDENTVLIEGLNGDIQMVRIDAISTVAAPMEMPWITTWAWGSCSRIWDGGIVGFSHSFLPPYKSFA